MPRRFRPIALAVALAAVATIAPGAARSADPPAPPESPGEIKRGPGYQGALFLYEMKEVTVVFPAGPGEDVATNRRSAEARARFLREAYGIAARVIADVAATPEDRRTNLLVLGWTNALLGGPDAPRPFERRADGLSLLGELVGSAGDDLLLFHRSPYASDRHVVFWSRLDPERDRFMVLPRIGSDWAVVRDFRAVRQGMFVPTETWPPVRDRESEGNHEPRLAEAEGRFTTATSEHYTVYHDASRVEPPELQAILGARQAAFAKAVAALGAPPAGYRIDLWVYEDEKQKKEITGVEDTVHALVRERELHMTRRAARVASAREEAHLIARVRLGPTFSTPLYEGLGIAVDGSWRGRDLDLEGALLSSAALVPPLADLLDEERFRKAIDGPAAPAAGLFVAWLRAAHPAAALAAVYTLKETSLGAVGKALGRAPTDIEVQYRGWLAERAAARATDVAVVKAEADAKERLAAGDYEGVAASLERALALKPSDPQILFNLASALMRTERMADAEAAFRKVLALPLGPGQSRFRIFAHYQIGRILDIGGRREEALASYRRVLELPDEFDAHRLARERLESPATREQLE